MKVIGIIAELNPYHLGHVNLIDNAVKKVGRMHPREDIYTVILLSGNFVQRGVPAIFDKYTRAFSCLDKADAVFEMPVIFSTGSAREFASAGIAFFERTGITDYIAFGAEDADTESIADFYAISDLLCKETDSFKEHLKDNLSKGLSFPAARAAAIAGLPSLKKPDILSKPNNILAIEYLTALKKKNSKINPLIIERSGSAYNEKIISEERLPSATAIRSSMLDAVRKAGQKINHEIMISKLSHTMTSHALETIKPYLTKETPLLKDEALMPFIMSRLINGDIDSLKDILDMNDDLLNKLSNVSNKLPITYDELIDNLKTRNITRTRINRVLLHIALNIKEELEIELRAADYMPYANLLALKKSSSLLLRNIEEYGNIEIINKKSAFKSESLAVQEAWLLDCRATDLYNQLLYSTSHIKLPNELSSSVRIIY